jgi:hypothetical protein
MHWLARLNKVTSVNDNVRIYTGNFFQLKWYFLSAFFWPYLFENIGRIIAASEEQCAHVGPARIHRILTDKLLLLGEVHYSNIDFTILSLCGSYTSIDVDLENMYQIY